MRDIDLRDNHRNVRPVSARSELPAVEATSQQRLVNSVDENASLQQVLATISTPASKWLEVISRSLGRAEAEIEFTERIRIREE